MEKNMNSNSTKQNLSVFPVCYGKTEEKKRCGNVAEFHDSDIAGNC